MIPTPGGHGAYTLANDSVLGWFEPFVASLRDHEPDLPLVVLPYDERTARLRALAERYRFTVWDDPSLTDLDDLGVRLTSPGARRRHNFRKLAVFWGPLDHFMFLDSDIIVLDRIAPMLDVYARSDLDLVYLDASVNSVYRTDAFRRDMVERHASVGWNSGTWLARRGRLSLDEATAVLDGATTDLDEITRWGEQTFLNYVSDVQGWTRASLADLDPAMPRSSWARHREVVDEAPMRLVHWAGDRASPLMPRARHYLRYRLRSLGSLPQRARFLLVAWPVAGARVLLSRAKRAVTP